MERLEHLLMRMHNAAAAMKKNPQKVKHMIQQVHS